VTIPAVGAQLEGKRILVTGGATGIGAAAVQALSAAGADVTATFHTTPPRDDLQATWLNCDVRDPAQVTATVQSTVDALGGLDVLVHAAGIWQAGIPGDVGAEDLEFVLDTNFKSTVYTNQAAHAVMAGPGGRIINLGSAEGVLGSPISASYAAAKAAVHAWTRSAAKVWASQNVTVNALAPAMNTPGADRLRDFLGPDAAPFLDQQLQATIPLGGKLGDAARDLGPVLVFLAGDGARFITGQLLAVDGGLMMLGA
jgi:NAD(P)-dependent dehydrogenase (short-subunit alcohol dehydrogenase family)